jgi:hypothetical protein
LPRESWEGTNIKIGFIGNFQSGYVGEVADETHLAREMQDLKHLVHRIPRDEWREYVIEGAPVGKYPNIPENVSFDIIYITKWHHFYDGSFIEAARKKYDCPVFYWVWDYMQNEPWHMAMVREANLYLGNDIKSPNYNNMQNTYYFPFDVADSDLSRFHIPQKENDVVFFGSYLEQGDRIKYLNEIKNYINLKIFSWNYEEWTKLGFDAYPAVYGDAFNREVANSKIVLGFSVEPHSWGYWSNRVGKVLLGGGFLLYQYAPGMELFLGDGAEYFSSVDELKEKIDHYLIADTEREDIARIGWLKAQDRFNSRARVKELMILTERFIKKGDQVWHC